MIKLQFIFKNLLRIIIVPIFIVMLYYLLEIALPCFKIDPSFDNIRLIIAALFGIVGIYWAIKYSKKD